MKPENHLREEPQRMSLPAERLLLSLVRISLGVLLLMAVAKVAFEWGRSVGPAPPPGKPMPGTEQSMQGGRGRQRVTIKAHTEPLEDAAAPGSGEAPPGIAESSPGFGKPPKGGF